MKIGIAADHGGFELKEKLKAILQPNYSIQDFGAHIFDVTDDYPDHVLPLAEAVSKGEIERGIAICGSGIGACIVANKVIGVRAALINESYSAHQGVEHDDMNIICLGARVIGETYAEELIKTFLQAKYSGEERHERRLTKLKNIESKHTQ
ncbi:RpiB/LacA/LacB family sugar-phosphate isomerase [Catalinimonas sp. 4WD22]|uniref:RpiB/LacA/LacB family sugar-phosphate isomerase n=1 Tax=Catalinimonas locisalis TaxID=3133978 RepID=UPI00310116E4